MKNLDWTPRLQVTHSSSCYQQPAMQIGNLSSFLVVLGLIMIPIRMQVRWVIELLLSLQIKQGSFLLAALAGITHCCIVFPSNTWIRRGRGGRGNSARTETLQLKLLWNKFFTEVKMCLTWQKKTLLHLQKCANVHVCHTLLLLPVFQMVLRFYQQ